VVRELRVSGSARTVFMNVLVENFYYRLQTKIESTILREIHK